MIIRTAALLSLCFAVSATADEEEWSPRISKAIGNFAPLRPLKAEYQFGWSGIKAGRAEADFTRSKEGQYILRVTGNSTGAARVLWKLDADSVSTVEPATLLPIKLVQKEVYSDESRTTTVNFSPEGAARSRVCLPPEENPNKVKRFKYAPVHDLHSALLFVRSQPLKKGDVITLAVYPSSRGYIAEVEVLDRATIKAGDREWPAIKLSLKLQAVNKKMELENYSKFKKAIGWMSDDADRLLLRIESEIAVGKVWMELKSLSFGPES